MGEGITKCLPSKKLGKKLGIKKLYFKDETKNPTNSFKDRAAALLISHARSWEFNSLVCASNGNQGASLAAYSSLEGMRCVNIIPDDIDIGKKAQMIAYNSEIIVKGHTVDDCLNEALSDKYKKEFYQCTPEFNPLTIEAQKTISYEIFNEIGLPDWIITPTGSGGLLISLWKGFKELKDSKIISKIPKFVSVQPQGLAPIVDDFVEKERNAEEIHQRFSKSIALGVLVKKPMYKDLVLDILKKNDGFAIAIPENLILNSVEELINNEGIFAEPASAMTIAAINSLIQKDLIDINNDKIVCIITGSGLKAPYVLEALSSRAKTAGMGAILSTKLKILSQIRMAEKNGINGTKLKEIIGSISRAAIYQHLKELEQKNLIIRKKEGKKVFYFITENGKKVIDALNTLITLL
ncbi:MAG: pyridoxal-phosphate dependent enzyme [Promethearchaeia archaeon]